MAINDQLSQLQSQRQQLEERKKELDPYKEKVAQAEQENTQAREIINQNRTNALSQRSLRNQNGAGGLNARRKVLNTLQENENVVGQRETQVADYKSQILSAETELNSAIAQVDDAIDDINDYELARKYYADGVPYSYVEDGRVKRYLRKMYMMASAQEAYQQQAINTYNETGKLPDNLQKSFDKYIAKGFSEEKAFKVLGFNIQTGRDQASRPTTGNDVQIQNLNIQALPSVDAQSKVLNISNSSVVNGLGSNNRAYTIDSVSLPSTQQSGNTNRSWIGRIVDTFKSDIQKDKETYNSQLGGFVSVPATGPSGTVSVRPPTFEEQKQLDSANYRGNFLSVPASEIVSKSRQFSELTKDFDKLDVNEQNLRVEQLKALGSRITDEGEILPPTVGVGFGSIKREISIDRLDTNNPRRVVKSAIGELVYERVTKEGIPVAVFYGGAGMENVKLPENRINLFQIAPEREVTISRPAQGTIQVDPITGKEILYTETKVTVPASNIFIPSNTDLAKTARLATEVGPYFIPYAGQALFFGEATYDLGYEVKETGSLTAGAVNYAKKYPLEAVGLVTLGATKVVSKITKPEVQFLAEVSEESSALNKANNARARNIMSRSSEVLRNDEKLITARSFEGAGVSTSSQAGRRTIITTPLRRALGMRPIYLGNAQGGEKIIKKVFDPLTGFREKITTVSAKQARESYNRALNILEGKGYSESQARQMLRRVAPSDRVFVSRYGGNVVQTVDKSGESVKVFIDGNQRIINLQSPTRVKGNGFEIISKAKGGKGKNIQIQSNLEETKNIAPKGKEAGDRGSKTFFEGSSEETNLAEQLGKQTRQFKEGAVAEKVAEIKTPLSSVERYKVGEISQETTYLKGNKVSTSVSDITVVNPEVVSRKTIDYVEGVAKLESKQGALGKGFETSSDEFTTVFKKDLPFRTVDDSINRVAPNKNVPKTPFSKTFGEPRSQFDKVFGPVDKPVVLDTAVASEGASKALAETSAKVVKPSVVENVALDLAEEAPTYVGGLGKSKSVFYGVSSADVQVDVQGPLSLPGVSSKSVIDVRTNNVQGDDLADRTKIIDKATPTSFEILRSPQQTRVEMKSAPSLKEKLNSMLKIKQDLRLGQESKTRITQKTTQRTKNSTRITPKIIKVPLKLPTTSPSKVGNILSKVKKAFDVVTLKGGKEVTIAEGLPEGLATKVAVSKVLGSARASYELRERGTTFREDINFKAPSSLFTKSKVNPNRFVQVLNTRIKGRSERKDVMSGPGKKSRKIKWF